jgi:hypothetical protein
MDEVTVTPPTNEEEATKPRDTYTNQLRAITTDKLRPVILQAWEKKDDGAGCTGIEGLRRSGPRCCSIQNYYSTSARAHRASNYNYIWRPL